MRISILTQYYPPEIGAPQRRLSELVKGLAARGHEVTVLTAMPNYPKGVIFAGYGGRVREERCGNVRIIRTFIYPTQSPEFLKRLANYFSFVFSALFVGIFRLQRCDYLLTESPPLFLGITGFLLSRAKGARWIFNVSDLWPESAVRLGVLRPGMAMWLSERLEAFCYSHAWLVSGQSHSILASIAQRFPRARTLLFSNGVNIEQFSPRFRADLFRAYANNDRPVALYAGLHGLAQGLDQVLDAAMLMSPPAVEIFFLGDGPMKKGLKARAEVQGLKHVHFLDAIPSENMPAWVASADIALVILEGFIPGAVPSKLYEAMASETAVLLVANGEPAELVKKFDVGLVVEPKDVRGLADALQLLASDPGLRKRFGVNGRRTAEQFYDRRVLVDQFATYLENENGATEDQRKSYAGQN
jgi:colanic acid biosynthesis glycosyl transferase WcaI